MSDPTPELIALEARLRGLAPASPSFDRDALFFRAGQAAAGGRAFWPALAITASLLAAVLGGILILRQPRTVEVIRTVVIEVPVPTPTEAREPVGSLLPDPGFQPRKSLQERLLREGLDGLGPWSTPPENSALPDVPLSGFLP